MSDTPETDAAREFRLEKPEYCEYGECGNCDRCEAEDREAMDAQELAEQTSRERDEARRERDEARRLASVWEKLALREASINGAKLCAKEEAK